MPAANVALRYGMSMPAVVGPTKISFAARKCGPAALQSAVMVVALSSPIPFASFTLSKIIPLPAKCSTVAAAKRP